MAEIQTGSKKMAAPRWMRVLLGVSLALNLLVIGLVSGAYVRMGGLQGLDRLRAPPRTVGAAMFRELSGEDRRALRDRSNGMNMGGSMPMTHHARLMAEAMEVSEAVRAVPFDPQALSDILEQQARKRQGFQKSVQQVWVERVTTMSASEREAYGARLLHAMNRPRPKDRPAKSRD